MVNLATKILGRKDGPAAAIAPVLARIVLESGDPDGLLGALDRGGTDGDALAPLLLNRMLATAVSHDELRPALQILDRCLRADGGIAERGGDGALSLFNAQARIALSIVAEHAVAGVDRTALHRLSLAKDAELVQLAKEALAAIGPATP